MRITSRRIDLESVPNLVALSGETQNESRRLQVITTSTVDSKAHDLLRASKIVCRTYSSLESGFLGLERYALSAVRSLSLNEAPLTGLQSDCYVEQWVRESGGTVRLSASAWVAGIADEKSGCLGALLGNLGSGKTTILQHALHGSCEKFLKSPSTCSLMVYVPLSRYKNHSGLVDSMLRDVFAEHGIDSYPTNIVRHLCRKGRVVLLFDGLDEIHPLSSTDDVLNTVAKLLDYIGRDTRAVVSSRKHLFSNRDAELAMFGDQERANLANLSQEIRILLEKKTTSKLAYVEPFSREQIDEYLKCTCGGDYSSVRDAIDRIYGFRDMATTPVLLSMMRQTIPDMVRANVSFTIVPQLDLYELYTRRWINRDDGRAQLSTRQRTRLSQELALLLIRKEEFSASWSDIKDVLSGDPEWRSSAVGEGAAEIDIRNSTFLVRESDDVFRFAHRSILEYFAAKSDFERYLTGAKFVAPYSDGYQQFIGMFLAKKWLEDGSCPLPRRSLSLSEYSDRSQLSLMASTTGYFRDRQIEKPKVSLNISGSCQENVFLHFSNVVVENSDIDLTDVAGKISFENCVIRNSSIRVSRSFAEFDRCVLDRVSMDAPEKGWRELKLVPSEDGLGIQLSEYPAGVLVDVLYRWMKCNPHGHARVSGVEWLVEPESIRLAVILSRRLVGRSKIAVGTFFKGTDGDVCKKYIDGLLYAGWIEEDTSRQPHQLSIGAKGASLVKSLFSSPLASQKEFSSDWNLVILRKSE